MRKLLRANFSRLFKDKLFLVSLALMFVMGTALQIMHCAAGILLSISYILPHTVLGLLLFGGFVTQPSVLLLYTGVNFALMVAYSSLFVLTSMLSQSKANTTAMCILLAFVLLFVGVYLTSALN